MLKILVILSETVSSLVKFKELFIYIVFSPIKITFGLEDRFLKPHTQILLKIHTVVKRACVGRSSVGLH